STWSCRSTTTADVLACTDPLAPGRNDPARVMISVARPSTSSSPSGRCRQAPTMLPRLAFGVVDSCDLVTMTKDDAGYAVPDAEPRHRGKGLDEVAGPSSSPRTRRTGFA